MVHLGPIHAADKLIPICFFPLGIHPEIVTVCKDDTLQDHAAVLNVILQVDERVLLEGQVGEEDLELQLNAQLPGPK